MSTEKLTWDLQEAGAGVGVQLKGPVNEDSNFEQLRSELNGKAAVQFVLNEIDRINSCGVREWVNFVRSFPENIQLEMKNCSPAIVAQLNMIDNFSGHAQITSVYAPYVCDECGHEEDFAFDLVPGSVPEVEEKTCPKCGAEMEFDDLEESYFAFLAG